MLGLVRAISAVNLALGRVAAPLILIITALVLFEVSARYFFNAPTSWSNEMNQYLLCALVMFGGGYTLRNYGHTRVDIIHTRFSPQTKARVEILTGLLVTLFCLPMIYFGVKVTWHAMMTGQTSVSAAQLLLWPSMATVPLGAFFLMCQALANALDSVSFLFTGKRAEES